jgi:hypothetical protein
MYGGLGLLFSISLKKGAYSNTPLYMQNHGTVSTLKHSALVQKQWHTQPVRKSDSAQDGAATITP